MKIRKFNEMTREEFIKWLEMETYFDRENDDDDTEWEFMVDYADYVWDKLKVEEDKVIFDWEEISWGSKEYKRDEYSFDEFVAKYKADELK